MDIPRSNLSQDSPQLRSRVEASMLHPYSTSEERYNKSLIIIEEILFNIHLKGVLTEKQLQELYTKQNPNFYPTS